MGEGIMIIVIHIVAHIILFWWINVGVRKIYFHCELLIFCYKIFNLCVTSTSHLWSIATNNYQLSICQFLSWIRPAQLKTKWRR